MPERPTPAARQADPPDGQSEAKARLRIFICHECGTAQQVPWCALYAACARTGTALEVNASPDRMDLPPEHIAAARDAGVKFAVDTDAHSLVDLTNARYGVAAARFGFLTTEDVINTWPLGRLREFFAKGRSRQRLLASSMWAGKAGNQRRSANYAGTRGGLRRRGTDAVRQVGTPGHLRRDTGR
jgi:hypothetical protein